jgi:hypothetical protein
MSAFSECTAIMFCGGSNAALDAQQKDFCGTTYRPYSRRQSFLSGKRNLLQPVAPSRHMLPASLLTWAQKEERPKSREEREW